MGNINPKFHEKLIGRRFVRSPRAIVRVVPVLGCQRLRNDVLFLKPLAQIDEFATT